MDHGYDDITARAGKPDWYDQHAAPRYGDFDPRMVTVYADEVALVAIRCQACDHLSRVAFVAPTLMQVVCSSSDDTPPEELIARTHLDRETLHYGDPPNCDYAHAVGCFSGRTMNCVDDAVVEWWENSSDEGWHRVPEKEGPLAATV